jgi:hypothetical protein
VERVWIGFHSIMFWPPRHRAALIRRHSVRHGWGGSVRRLRATLVLCGLGDVIPQRPPRLRGRRHRRPRRRCRRLTGTYVETGKPYDDMIAGASASGLPPSLPSSGSVSDEAAAQVGSHSADGPTRRAEILPRVAVFKPSVRAGTVCVHIDFLNNARSIVDRQGPAYAR